MNIHSAGRMEMKGLVRIIVAWNFVGLFIFHNTNEATYKGVKKGSNDYRLICFSFYLGLLHISQ